MTHPSPPLTMGPYEANLLTTPTHPSSSLVSTHPLASSTAVAVLGDALDTSLDTTFLRGRGTQVLPPNRLVATVSGVVERVNKLISVRPLRGRYQAQTGDVVVGRVTAVEGKRWRLEVRGAQDAFLQLSAVTLPGSLQRRTTTEDELNMRLLFREGDVMVAEVQQLFHDGSVALQTRSNKYGLLHHGMLVDVPSSLIKRLKQHFTSIPSEQVNLVIGLNGMIWVSASPSTEEEASADGAERGASAPTTPEARERVVRVAAAIKSLASAGCLIHPTAIAAVCAQSRSPPLTRPADMARSDFVHRVLSLHLSNEPNHDDM